MSEMLAVKWAPLGVCLLLPLVISCSARPAADTSDTATAVVDPSAPLPHEHEHEESYLDECKRRRCGDVPCPPTVCEPKQLAQSVAGFLPGPQVAWKRNDHLFAWNPESLDGAPLESLATEPVKEQPCEAEGVTLRCSSGRSFERPAPVSSVVASTLPGEDLVFWVEANQVWYASQNGGEAPSIFVPDNQVRSLLMEHTMLYVVSKRGLRRYPAAKRALQGVPMPLSEEMGVTLSQSPAIDALRVGKRHVFWTTEDKQLFVLAK